MIHAETDSCIAALDLDATSAVESKLFVAEILPSLPRDNLHYGIGNDEYLDAARGPFRVKSCLESPDVRLPLLSR
jgi:hypothetical protein